jgi:hypothetical protein
VYIIFNKAILSAGIWVEAFGFLTLHNRGVVGISHDGIAGVEFVGVAYHAKPVVQEKATYALNHSGLDGVAHLFTA